MAEVSLNVQCQLTQGGAGNDITCFISFVEKVFPLEPKKPAVEPVSDLNSGCLDEDKPCELNRELLCATSAIRSARQGLQLLRPLCCFQTECAIATVCVILNSSGKSFAVCATLDVRGSNWNFTAPNPSNFRAGSFSALFWQGTLQRQVRHNVSPAASRNCSVLRLCWCKKIRALPQDGHSRGGHKQCFPKTEPKLLSQLLQADSLLRQHKKRQAKNGGNCCPVQKEWGCVEKLEVTATQPPTKN